MSKFKLYTTLAPFLCFFLGMVTAGMLGGCNGSGGGNSSQPTLSTLIVSPSTASLETATTQQFAAMGTFSDNSTKDLTSTVTWTSSNTQVATISSTGFATATSAGQTTIAATMSGVSGAAIVTVTVEWLAFQSANGEILLQYPPTLVEREHEPVDGSRVIDFVGANPGEGFTVAIVDENPERLDLMTWADQQQWPFPGDWREQFETTSVSQVEALRDPQTGSVIFTIDKRVYYFTNGIGQDRIILDTDTFKAILDTIQISN